MRLQVLGSGGYFPNEHRHTACYFLPDSAALLDAGTGTFRVLPQLSSATLDVFLTHAHLDHITGLTYLLLPMVQERLQQVRVFGPDETLEAVRTHLFSEPVFPVLPDFTFCPLSEHAQVQLVDGGLLTHHPLVSHPGGSTAYRIDWPASSPRPARSLAYVTDTCVDGTYTEFLRGVDLLLHECYFADDQAEWAIKTGHSHTTPVAELAREIGAQRLLLIHIDPQYSHSDTIGVDAARAIFPHTDLATDLAEVPLDDARQ